MKKQISTAKRYLKVHPNRAFLLFYIGCLVIATTIVFLRFPNNFIAPNFYAEDGTVYLSNIIKQGFLNSIIIPFNGYYIFGLYLLTGIGIVINSIVFHSVFTELPRSLSMVSYFFIGFSITLPLILFRQKLGYYWGIILVLLCAFVPLRQSDYTILGTIGNLKWLFFYVAFILVLYRHINFKKKWKQLILVDIAIFICAYTNSTTYLLIPFVFMPYLVELINKLKNSHKFELPRESSFVSACVLTLCLLPQLIYVKLHGIPKIAGYLDTPFNGLRAIEIFIGRSFLYGFMYGLYQSLTDLKAIIIFAVSAIVLFYIFQKKSRYILFYALYSILAASFLFALTRPGISDFFFYYKSGGPDQFFYVQTLISYFIIVFALCSRKLSILIKSLLIILILVYTIANYPVGSSAGRNNMMQKNRGNIYTNLPLACEKHSPNADLRIYPSDDWNLTITSEIACRGIKK